MELLAILLAAVGLVWPGSHASQAGVSDQVCFSKHEWSAPDELRPCIRITGLYEDGSFEAAVGNARGDERYRVRIGNRAD